MAGGSSPIVEGKKGEKDITKFQKELGTAIEALTSKRDMRRLAGMMVSNQDAEFPTAELADGESSKDRKSQDMIYDAMEAQYIFWKTSWSEETEEAQMMMGLPTFNFHLMSLLSAAMDTYWFTDKQQVELVDWLRDMVSGAELRPLRLENEKLSKENTACMNKLDEYNQQLQEIKAGQEGGNVSFALVSVAVLLALAMGHIITVHMMN